MNVVDDLMGSVVQIGPQRQIDLPLIGVHGPGDDRHVPFAHLASFELSAPDPVGFGGINGFVDILLGP